MKLQTITSAILTAALSLASPTFAAPLEIGIGTHFGHSSGNLTIARGFYGTSIEPSIAGLVSVRDDISWGQTEIVKDQITLRDGGPKLKNLLTSIPTISRPMLVLSYTNQYHDGGGPITTDEGRAAFSRFATGILPNFPTAAYVEIGNEWNLTAGSAMAADYTKLVKAAIPAIKAMDAPKPKVIVGALADDYPDWAFAKQLIAGGALDGADGLSVHLYNHCMGDPKKITAEEMGARLDALHLHMGDAYANTPIYVTEFGWPVAPGSNGCAVAENVGGLNTLRFLLEASIRPWIGGVWIYEMMDNGTPDTANTRYNSFGLVRQTSEIVNAGNAAVLNFAPIPEASIAAATKPMGCVMKEPLTKLIGLRPQTISNDGNLRSAVFNDNGRQAIVIWNATTYPTTVPAGSIKVYGADASSLAARSVCNGISGGVITSATTDGSNGTLNFNLDGGHPLVIEVAAGAVVTSVDLRD